MTNTTMTQDKFWNLPAVKRQQDIQKRNPYGSVEHKLAHMTLIQLLVDKAGMTLNEAIEYMGEY